VGTKTSEIVHAGYALALDYDISGNLIYFGKADRGASKAAAVWYLMRLAYNAESQLVDMQWADGNGLFDNVWDNRVTLTYS